MLSNDKNIRKDQYLKAFYRACKEINLYETHKINNQDKQVCVGCKNLADDIEDIQHDFDCGIKSLDDLIQEYENYTAFNSLFNY